MPWGLYLLRRDSETPSRQASRSQESAACPYRASSKSWPPFMKWWQMRTPVVQIRWAGRPTSFLKPDGGLSRLQFRLLHLECSNRWVCWFMPLAPSAAQTSLSGPETARPSGAREGPHGFGFFEPGGSFSLGEETT